MIGVRGCVRVGGCGQAEHALFEVFPKADRTPNRVGPGLTTAERRHRSRVEPSRIAPVSRMTSAHHPLKSVVLHGQRSMGVWVVRKN
jgi:hypothetical protein